MNVIEKGDVLEFRNGLQFCVEDYDYNPASAFPHKVWGYERIGGLPNYYSFTHNLKILNNDIEKPFDVVKIHHGLCSLCNVSKIIVEDETFGEL